MSLNPQQQAAVQHVRGPLLILAGAGSGKTRVITQRVGHLIALGVEPAHILAVSFTNKAAGEMRERVAGLVGRKIAGEVHLSTFHALGAQLLRQYIDRIGYRRPFTILDTGDQLKVLRDVIEHEGYDRQEVAAKDVLAVISRAKNGFCQPKALTSMRFNPMVSYAQRLFRPYMDACRALNAVDFDDLQTLPIRVFKEHPDVLEVCRDRYRFVMVDEYQDTNDTQLLMLRMLCAPNNNLCVVGDDDQAIYAFRGAVTRNILNFEKHFPGAKIIKLEQNYRSTSHILQAANAVVRHNEARREKALWSALGEGERIAYYELEDEREEAEFVVSALAREGRAGAPWSEFAVLMRTARLSQAFEESLQAEGIPYRMIGGTKFFDRREVKDLLSYARVILNPSDEVSLRRIVNTPGRGIGHTTLGRLSEYALAERISMYETLKRAGSIEGINRGQAESLEGLRALLDEVRGQVKARRERLDVIFGRLVETLNFKPYVMGLEKSEKIGRIRVENITNLIASLATHVDRGGDLEAWVARCTLADGFGSSGSEEQEQPDAVTLMTLHASKGLEFPTVFLVGFEEGLLPHARSLEAGGDGDVEEERRLVYVGITRAQRKLFLTSARVRGRGTASKRRSVSRYLEEIPPEHIQTFGHGEHVPEVRTERKRRLKQIMELLD